MTDPYPQPAHSEDAVRAHVALRDGKILEARSLAKAALNRDPKDPILRFILAQAMVRSNAAPQALPHFTRLVREQPDNTWFRVEYARALDGVARPAEAIAELDRVIEADPDHGFAIRLRAEVLRNSGQGDRAWSELAGRIDSLPRTAAIAMCLGNLIPRDENPDAVLVRLRQAASDETVTPPDRRSSLCLIARILENHARYREAFDAATDAHEFVLSKRVNQHAQIYQMITPELIGSIEPADLDASGLVLVCGMPRSGTTVTEQVLAAHPRVATAGEYGGLPIATDEAIQIARRDGIVPSELSTRLGKRYLKAVRAHAGAKPGQVVIDKMLTNILLLGLADRLLPGIRVIRCLRDPRDIAISCYTQDFGERHTYRTSLEALADELLLHEQAAVRWSAQLGDRYTESSLESLIADPETGARRLVSHLGVEWDDACLRFHEGVSHVRTASTEQVRSGLNTRGVGRWRHYEKQLAPLIERIDQLLPETGQPSG